MYGAVSFTPPSCKKGLSPLVICMRPSHCGTAGCPSSSSLGRALTAPWPTEHLPAKWPVWTGAFSVLPSRPQTHTQFRLCCFPELPPTVLQTPPSVSSGVTPRLLVLRRGTAWRALRSRAREQASRQAARITPARRALRASLSPRIAAAPGKSIPPRIRPICSQI